MSSTAIAVDELDAGIIEHRPDAPVFVDCHATKER
jgi:hypothetical protein